MDEGEAIGNAGYQRNGWRDKTAGAKNKCDKEDVLGHTSSFA
jgi:hypothetical protein